MDIYQDLFSQKNINNIQRRIYKDYEIRDDILVDPRFIKKNLIEMSKIILAVICNNTGYTYADQIEGVVQIFISNYAMKYNLNFPAFRPQKLESPNDYLTMDAYNEFRNIQSNTNTFSHTTKQYNNLRRYALERHVDKDCIDGMPNAREFGFISRRTRNFADDGARNVIQDYEYKINDNDELDTVWSETPKDHEKIKSYRKYYERDL